MHSAFGVHYVLIYLRGSAAPVEINTEAVNSIRSAIFNISIPVNCMSKVIISCVVRATKSSSTVV